MLEIWLGAVVSKNGQEKSHFVAKWSVLESNSVVV